MNDLYIAIVIVALVVLSTSALVAWLNRPSKEERSAT